ncbi:MAG: RNA polymerase subunit sigma-24, partial [Muribaculaceae bacterium]|nr:RNA polymerase subunit sigma-24 [Muribaculaceae bacterium]
IDLLNDRSLCEESIEDVMVSGQLTRDLQRLVAELPDVQRQVLMMRIYRDMSFKEIAEETGVSINTALGRMRYALRNMRRMAEENQILESA